MRKELHRVSHCLKEGAPIGDAIPFVALVMEADDGDASGHWERVAEVGMLCGKKFYSTGSSWFDLQPPGYRKFEKLRNRLSTRLR
jgi:hypothetical protein